MIPSLSNIAWNNSQLNENIYCTMQALGFRGIETAPGKISPGKKISEIPIHDIDKWLKILNTYGIHPVAMQSLFYGTHGLDIFHPESHDTMIELFDTLCKIAKDAKIPYLIFGAPKNRIIPQGMTQENAYNLAGDFFKRLGDIANKYGVKICIEPVSAGYGGNFLTNTTSTHTFVKKLRHPNICMHLDIGTMIMEDETADKIGFSDIIKDVQHVHISRPHLGVIETIHETDEKIVGILKQYGYKGAVSVELGPNTIEANPVGNIDGTLRKVNKLLQQ